MAGKLFDWKAQAATGVARFFGEKIPASFAMVKKIFVKTPEETVKANKNNLNKLEDWNLRRGNAEDAFRRANPTATQDQVNAYLNAVPELVSPTMPWSTLKKATVTSAVALTPFAIVAAEGAYAGYTTDKNTTSATTGLTPFLSAAADGVESLGGALGWDKSKANFLTDTFTSLYARAAEHKYQTASPEEREEKGLLPAYETIQRIGTTEQYRPIASAFTNYAKDRRDFIAESTNAPVIQAAREADAAASAAGARAAQSEQEANADRMAAKEKLRTVITNKATLGF